MCERVYCSVIIAAFILTVDLVLQHLYLSLSGTDSGNIGLVPLTIAFSDTGRENKNNVQTNVTSLRNTT